uniref:Elongator complex protein 5 n=1 Tax=Populus alba TaxID=43335 RepID=A0A4U5PSR4_POPAL|nr:hypothetical protein D5086_0000183020 [Populus alba]
MMSGNFTDVSYEASLSLSCVCRNVKDLDKLYSLILELGKGLFGQGKDCFSVAIDSNRFLASFGCYIQTFMKSRLHLFLNICPMWCVEPLHQSANGQGRDLENLSLLEQNFGKGKLQVRFKRRNGRSEGFHIDQSDINFTSVSSEDELFNQINQGLLPKVQFNLDLSEKECIGRARVVLSFDLQGNGKPIQIHDSGRSLAEGKTEVTLGSSWTSQKAEDYGEGDIIYFLDSDDEMPDSDEDSDDDLDV